MPTRVSVERGYCFITMDLKHPSGRADVFCHFSQFELAGLRHPEVGNRYEFEVVPSDRGIHAINIEAVL
jgi:cold shock CspA family protein